MKSMTNVFKKTACFILIFVLVLSCGSLSVFAIDETKTVTCDRLITFNAYPSEVNTILSSPSSYVPSTYNYDDGTYKGTLQLTNAVSWSPGGPVGGMYQIRINATYSGTVYVKYKTVTCSNLITFNAYPSEVNTILSSPSRYVPSSYYYDDGAYKGTLQLTNAVSWSPGGPVGGMYQIRLYATYSGTVTRK